MLHDLPVAKPRSTYIKDNEGKLVLTKEGVPSDKLSFPLFKLECAAMQSINYVILEEALDLSKSSSSHTKAYSLLPKPTLAALPIPAAFL
jgi:hypothetical protein